jgi:hypothetical protein
MKKRIRVGAAFMFLAVALPCVFASGPSEAGGPMLSVGFERYEMDATTFGQEFSGDGRTGREVVIERSGVGFLLRSALLLPVLGGEKRGGLVWAVGPVLHVFVDDMQESDAPALRGRIDFIAHWERSIWQIGESRLGPTYISLDGHIGMGLAFFRDKDFRLGQDFRAYRSDGDPGTHIQDLGCLGIGMTFGNERFRFGPQIEVLLLPDGGFRGTRTSEINDELRILDTVSEFSLVGPLTATLEFRASL